MRFYSFIKPSFRFSPFLYTIVKYALCIIIWIFLAKGKIAKVFVSIIWIMRERNEKRKRAEQLALKFFWAFPIHFIASNFSFCISTFGIVIRKKQAVLPYENITAFRKTTTQSKVIAIIIVSTFFGRELQAVAKKWIFMRFSTPNSHKIQ